MIEDMQEAMCNLNINITALIQESVAGIEGIAELITLVSMAGIINELTTFSKRKPSDGGNNMDMEICILTSKGVPKHAEIRDIKSIAVALAELGKKRSEGNCR